MSAEISRLQEAFNGTESQLKQQSQSMIVAERDAEQRFREMKLQYVLYHGLLRGFEAN